MATSTMQRPRQQEALPSMTKGAYNDNAKVQHHAIQPALEMLTDAANSIPITPGRPIQILELGCSQGVNSIQPVKTILQALATRASTRANGDQQQQQEGGAGDSQLEVVVTHEDLPSNDFESLFGLLWDKEKTYLPQDPYSPLAVYPSVVGRSCYERLMPTASVHMVFSYNTLHWMSRKPVPCHDSLFIHTSKDEAVHKAWAHQSLSDLKNVLQLRAMEVVPGGVMQVLFPVLNPSSTKTWATKTMQKVTPEWAAEGKLSGDEVAAMAVPIYMRTEEEVRQVLEEAGKLWEVKRSFVRETVGPSYTKFTAGEMTAAEYAATMRNQIAAVMQGYFTSQLALTRGPEVAGRMVSELFSRYQEILAEDQEEENIHMIYLSLRRTEAAVV